MASGSKKRDSAGRPAGKSARSIQAMNAPAARPPQQEGFAAELIRDFLNITKAGGALEAFLHALGDDSSMFVLEDLEKHIPASWCALLNRVVFNNYDSLMDKVRYIVSA